ncbi:MAG: hypothetical protein WC742_03215 [Gallionellaceae bacterium]|jgi:hypothetical protein
MHKLIQIICGAGGAETIEECARVPESLGATIIVIYALWPQYDYPNGDPNFAKTSDLVDHNFKLDDVESIAKKKGWHYVRMDKFAFNGEQYNFALDYIKNNGLECEHIWFVDSDECIDPVYSQAICDQVVEAKRMGLEQIRFAKRIEVLPGWRQIELNNILSGNYGILWGEALKVRRETFFDGNFHFKSNVNFAQTSIPLIHLHHFRLNAANRIVNGKWCGGGLEVDITSASVLYDSPYIQLLKEKFTHFYAQRSADSYLGPSIFMGVKVVGSTNNQGEHD